jgi:hypothetical protein
LGGNKTVHKARGRATPRTALALSQHSVTLFKMTHPSVFVAAVRRVKNGCSAMTAVHAPAGVGLQHVAALKPNKDVLHCHASFTSFTDSNGLRDPLKALWATKLLIDELPKLVLHENHHHCVVSKSLLCQIPQAPCALCRHGAWPPGLLVHMPCTPSC